MWPFGKREPRVERPVDRLVRRKASTPEGSAILREAYHLACIHPEWTDGQCIRAAYWGEPGDA